MLGSFFWQNGFFADFNFWAPPDFFADFAAGCILLIFVEESAQKNPPGKSPAKSSNFYRRKSRHIFFCRGTGPIEGMEGEGRGYGGGRKVIICFAHLPLHVSERERWCARKVAVFRSIVVQMILDTDLARFPSKSPRPFAQRTILSRQKFPWVDFGQKVALKTMDCTTPQRHLPPWRAWR